MRKENRKILSPLFAFLTIYLIYHRCTNYSILPSSTCVYYKINILLLYYIMLFVLGTFMSFFLSCDTMTVTCNITFTSSSKF